MRSASRFGWTAVDPISRLVLHIQRELIHHLSEVCLLRGLYARRGSGSGVGGTEVAMV